MSMGRTFQGSWELLGEWTQGDMSGAFSHRILDGTTSGYTLGSSDRKAKAKEIPPEANWVEIVFIGEGTGGFKYDLWGYACANGFAEKICDGSVMVDATATDAGTPKTDFPYKDITPTDVADFTDVRFADIITATSRHVNTVSVANSGGTNTGPAKIVFDAAGIKYIYLGITDMSTDAADCTRAWAIFRYF